MLHRAFPLVLVLVGCEGADVPGAPPLQSGPASNTLFTPGEGDGLDAAAIAKAVCTKLVGCLGGGSQAETRCIDDMATYTSFVIDGQRFVDCFNSISCQILQPDQIDDYVESCLDLDPSSLTCNGSAIHYCTSLGVCKDVPCTDFCELMNRPVSGSETVSCVMRNDGPTCSCPVEWDQLPGG